MLKKIIKITIETASILSLISMLAVAGLFVWVLLSPRTVFFITPYLEKELSSINTNFKVKIEDSVIQWDSQQRSIGIYANNVRIFNNTNDTVAILPEISCGFSLLRLLSGHLLSLDLMLTKPSFYIKTAQNISYAEPENRLHADEIIFNILHSAIASNDYSFKIHSIRVRDANIFISTSDVDMMWQVNDGYAKLERKKGNNIVKSEFKINFGKNSTYFDIIVENSKDKSITTSINFQDLPAYTLADIFPGYLLEQKMNMVFSGGSTLLFSNKGSLSGINLNINSADGTLNFPTFFKDSLDIKRFLLDLRLYDNLTRIAIDKMEVGLGDSSLKISGSINNIGKWFDTIPAIDLDAEILDLEAKDIDKYWPLQLGKTARDWVVTNIKSGTVPIAKGKFKFSSEDIRKIMESEKAVVKDGIPPILDNTIDATINVENANLTYMPNYPLVENVKAVVKFSGISMEARVESAKILNTSASNARIEFNNLWANDLKISIDGDFSGDAQDMIHFLKLTYKENPENKTMASIYNINGQTAGHVSLAIPIIQNLRYDDADIKISSTFKNSLLKGIVNGKDLMTSNLFFSLDKYDITAKGDVAINKIPATIELRTNFSDQNKEGFDLKMKGNFLPSELKDFGVAAIPFVTGAIGLDADINLQNDSVSIVGTADLTKSTIILDDLGFNKPDGTEGKAEFNILKSGNDIINIKEFKLYGDGFSMHGNAMVAADSGMIKDLSLSSATFGNSDFTASYTSSNQTDNLSVTGKSLDMSQIKISEWLRQNPSKLKKSFSMNIALNKLYMKNGEVLSDVISNLHCSVQMCTKGSLNAKIRQNNSIKTSLRNVGGRFIIVAQSDNAGALINALNISQNINGGNLAIDANISKSGEIVTTQGLIKMTDFTAVKTPLLGKILTLASFRGFEDLLNNEGISFKKFEAPFIMKNGVINITKAKSSGASIGITADGNIDTRKNDVDLKGVIVPAYAVNNIIGKIPFVGKIIIGKENEGIIATKYSLKGSYDDAKVSVNPLSILAPGFIRNIFDIFD